MEQEMVQVQPKIARRYVFTSPEIDAAEGLPGCVIAQYRRCGCRNCRCAQPGAAPHGPYFFHYWRSDGRARKRYVARLDAPRVAALCDRRRAMGASRRAVRRALRDCARLVGGLTVQSG
jgi:hypothetical protein